ARRRGGARLHVHPLRKANPEMTKLKDWLVAGLVLALGRGKPPRPPRGGPRIVAAGEPEPRAETLLLVLLFLATVAAAAFVVVYALDRLSHQTPWHGPPRGAPLGSLPRPLPVVARPLRATATRH